MMHVQCHNAQHVGRRARQEDSFAFSDASDVELVQRGGILAIVADGMGGMADGDKASVLATAAFLDAYVRTVSPENIESVLQEAMHAANAAVNEYALSAGGPDSTGTTLTAATVIDGALHWISVGDSRLYLYSKGVLRQLSEDHTLANDLDRAVQAGTLTAEVATAHPEREALTSCLGMSELDRINTGTFAIEDADLVLLCSDGLYKTLSDESIAKVLKRSRKSPAEALLQAVLKEHRERQDNVTVLSMHVAATLAADSVSILQRGMRSIGAVSRRVSQSALQRARAITGAVPHRSEAEPTTVEIENKTNVTSTEERPS